MAALKMKIETRSKVGTNRVNSLRSDEIIPAVIYKKGEETKTVKVSNVDFLKVYRKAGTTSVINLELDGEVYPVVIKEIQKHPVKNQILHVDFQGLNMDEKIKMHIPIYLNNRDKIALQPSVLTQLLDEVEVECLPGNIPHGANIDVSDMDFDTPRLVEDLDIASDETIDILTELDMTVCVLSEPSMEEELDEDEETEIDAEVPLVSEEEEE
jgi:large subunit ribosomal protein L25